MLPPKVSHAAPRQTVRPAPLPRCAPNSCCIAMLIFLAASARRAKRWTTRTATFGSQWLDEALQKRSLRGVPEASGPRKARRPSSVIAACFGNVNLVLRARSYRKSEHRCAFYPSAQVAGDMQAGGPTRDVTKDNGWSEGDGVRRLSGRRRRKVGTRARGGLRLTYDKSSPRPQTTLYVARDGIELATLVPR